MYVTIIVQHEAPESCIEANHMTAYLDERLDMVMALTASEQELSEALVVKIKTMIVDAIWPSDK